MKISARASGLISAGLVACAASALAPLSAAHAQRTSILERYSDAETFEDRRSSFDSAGYRIADIETCREPNGSNDWIVAVYNRPGASGSAIQRTSNSSNFTNEIRRQYDGGMRLVDVNVEGVGSGARYQALYEPGSGGQWYFARDSWNDFTSTWAGYRDDGFRVVDIDETIIGGRRHFFAVMRPGSQRQALYRDTSWSAFTDRWRDMTGNGWRLREVAASQTSGGRAGFMGVYERGSGGHALYAYNNWADLMQRWLELDRNGQAEIRMEDVECYSDGSRLHYVGVWRTPSAPRRTN